MSGDNWGQFRGQIGDTGDKCLSLTGDIGDNPPLGGCPRPRKGRGPSGESHE
jgi:hypothetical protein